MLTPRFKWECDVAGCCVFMGGTEHYDIYMGKCHERPYNPLVLLVSGDGLDHEYEDVGQMADSKLAAKDEALGLALTFVQCFFPTPERLMLDQIVREEGRAKV